MMDLKDIDKSIIGQASIFESTEVDAFLHIREHIRTNIIKPKDTISEIRAQTFLVEHAHELKELDSRIYEGEHYIIIGFDKIVEVAQQSLLKSVEEPKKGTHIIFVVRTKEILLQTLRSRAHAYRIQHVQKSENKNSPETFLRASFHERMNQLSPVIEKARGSDDVEKDLARKELVHTLNALETYIHEHFLHEHPKWRDALITIFEAERDMYDISSSIKMIFEHLALRIPRV